MREIVRAIAGPEGRSAIRCGGPRAADVDRSRLRHRSGGCRLGRSWSGVTQVVGVDTHPWTLAEAAHTYRDFGLARQDSSRRRGVGRPAEIAGAHSCGVYSERAEDESRAILLCRLLDRARAAAIACSSSSRSRERRRPGGRSWEQAFAAAGGRADEWRFRVELPPIVAKLDRAAGLDHSRIDRPDRYLTMPGRPEGLHYNRRSDGHQPPARARLPRPPALLLVTGVQPAVDRDGRRGRAERARHLG